MPFIPQVDTQIPLSAANPLDLQAKGFALGQAQLEAQRNSQQYKQQQDTQRALKDIFANADTSSPEGQADMIRQVGRVDPNAALSLQAQFGKNAETSALMKEHQSKAALNQQDFAEQQRKTGMEVGGEFARVGDMAFNNYQSQVKQGILPEKAWATASGQIKTELESLKQRYGSDPHALDMISKVNADNLTPETLQSGVQQLKAQLAGAQQKPAPSGYRYNAKGELEPIPGGSADPQQVKKIAEAKREPVEEVAAKARARKIASGGEPMSDEDAAFLARQAWAGDKSWVTGMGRGAQGPENILKVRHAIMEQGKKEGRSAEELAQATAEFEGAKSAQRTLGTRAANAGMAVNEAQNMSKLVIDASRKVKRTEFQDLNSLLLGAEKRTGSVEAIQYGEAINSYINAYARAVSPTGTPTVHDKEHAREILAEKFTEGQIEGGIAQLDKEMQAAKKSPGQTKQELQELATGKSGAKTIHWDDLK